MSSLSTKMETKTTPLDAKMRALIKRNSGKNLFLNLMFKKVQVGTVSEKKLECKILKFNTFDLLADIDS